MPHTWQDVVGGVLKADDRDGTNMSGAAEDAGEISIVCILGCDGVTADAPS